jgi:diketogulonate reductase-like aldo/keto reductase
MAKNLSEHTITLNTGAHIPVVGLGVWAMGAGAATENAVQWALEAGYRHIDTAAMYGNEKEVGVGIKKSGIARSDVFVTTKVWNTDHGYSNTLKAFDKSLSLLNMDYVDLYLIHWPSSGKLKETWKALEEIYQSGKAKAIGVANYTIRDLEEMKSYQKIPPAVNQVEFHPFLFRKELMRYCHSNHIAVVDYCPLIRGRKLNDERITAIAKNYHKTNAQIALRWAIQHGNIVIPKSAHKERIKENISLFDFEISPSDMQKMDALNENYSLVSG